MSFRSGFYLYSTSTDFDILAENHSEFRDFAKIEMQKSFQSDKKLEKF